jgi:signal transduction histidine kinase
METGTAQRWLELSQELNQAHDVEDLLCRLLSEAVALSGADGGVARVHGPREMALLQHDGHWEWLSNGDLSNGGRSAPLLPMRLRERLSVASTVVLPLPAGDEETGAVLVLYSRKPGGVSATVAPRLAELVALGTVALGRVTTYQRLHEMGQRLIDAQEAERKRLAGELHDSASQSLTALKLSLSMLRKRLGEANPNAELLDESVGLVDTVNQEIESIAKALQPPMFGGASLGTSMRYLCQYVAKQSGVDIHYEGEPAPPLEERIATAFYRFLQDALTNIVEHAGATEVLARLEQDEDTLALLVFDNGVGLEPDQPLGAGVRRLQERFELMGGEVSIAAPKAGGMVLVARYPL